MTGSVQARLLSDDSGEAHSAVIGSADSFGWKPSCPSGREQQFSTQPSCKAWRQGGASGTARVLYIRRLHFARLLPA